MKKFISVFGIIVSVAMIVCGIALKIPDKHVYVSSSSSAYYSAWEDDTGAEYLGGDCYNYIVEATLKAGYMNGILIAKSLSIVGGILLFFISAFSLMKRDENETQIRLLELIERNTKSEGKSEAQIKLLESIEQNTKHEEKTTECEQEQTQENIPGKIRCPNCGAINK